MKNLRKLQVRQSSKNCSVKTISFDIAQCVKTSKSVSKITVKCSRTYQNIKKLQFTPKPVNSG